MSEIYIIGNGASMAGFDYSLLAGKDCIVINDGWRKKPDAAYMLFCDEWFYLDNKQPQPEKDFWRFNGQIFSDLAIVANHPRIGKLTPKMMAIKSGKKRFDASDKNTGIKAIAFAYNLGYESIVLIGFDNKPAPHGPKQAVYDRYYAHHVELAALGLCITNLTPNSALDMYQTVVNQE